MSRRNCSGVVALIFTQVMQISVRSLKMHGKENIQIPLSVPVLYTQFLYFIKLLPVVGCDPNVNFPISTG